MNKKFSRFIAIGLIAILGITFGLLINQGVFDLQTSVSAQDKPTDPQIIREQAENSLNAPQTCALSGTVGTIPAGGSTGVFPTVRLFRDSNPSQCSFPAKTHPGTQAATNRPYNVYDITNTSSQPACVTFTLTNTNGLSDVFLSVHKFPFVAADISNAARYIGDGGASVSATGQITTFQTVIPANTIISIVITTAGNSTTGTTYTLNVAANNQAAFPACGVTGSGTRFYTGPAVAIPDNTVAGVNVTLPVTGIGRIRDLNFTFNTGGACDATVGNPNAAVDHTFVGDLKFTLTSPSGTSATFMNRRGGTRENICSTQIEDKSNSPLISSLTSITGLNVSGNFQPELDGRLSKFTGENADGVWTLNVSDNASADTGNLRRFGLNFTTNLFPNNNFDTDGRSDVGVFRPSNGAWYVQRSTNGFYAVAFGQNGDKIVPADYTGDGRTDVAVFRPSNQFWYVFDTSNNTFYGIPFGLATDILAPADYDGDGKTDIAVFRPSSGTWFIQGSLIGFYAVPFGQNGDVPTVGNFDGDNKADIAVFRPSNGVWYRLNSKDNSFFAVAFGQNGDKVVPADYTGDGKDDIAVFRAGTWFIMRSEDLTFYGIPFGLATDVPTPGDFDGDGRADQAVYRNGQWFIQQSNNGFTSIPFGFPTDIPTGSAYVY